LAAVQIEGLVKRYGKVLAVDGLSLTVDEGTLLGLIGPNGAGKTTTIKVMLGLLKPNMGKVEVFGKDPWDNPEIKTRIGVVYEKPIFPVHHEVLSYLEKACRIFGVHESKAKETLETVGLQKEAFNRPIKGLSAGMLQKFAIAHALIHEPEFVIADEPTSNLDPQARNEILNLFSRLHHDEKTTFLVSSHILPELSNICESVAIINQGRVWAQGSFLELCEKLRIGVTRISTDNPQKLVEVMRKLNYVRKIKMDSRGVSVDVPEAEKQQLYEDVVSLAKKNNVKISGIESKTALLEELYDRAVSQGRDG